MIAQYPDQTQREAGNAVRKVFVYNVIGKLTETLFFMSVDVTK